jgi:hypothetical protein
MVVMMMLSFPSNVILQIVQRCGDARCLLLKQHSNDGDLP